ncbi:MAG: MBL fold metallo-hydrolase [Thermoplasmatota archaeon]
MRLTVLGNPNRYLAPLSAGSGYLLEAGGARILLDCGQGIRAALETAGGAGALDAVVLSHSHYDHTLDLLPILPTLPKGIPLFVASGSRGALAALAHAYAFRGAFEAPGALVEGHAGETHKVKSLTLDFAPTQHGTPSMATRIRLHGRTVVYASDTAPCPALVALAEGADLLVCHTLLATADAESEHAKVHATAETAGRLAREAGAKRLLLSHRYWETTDEDALEAARRSFDAVELATPGGVYEL